MINLIGVPFEFAGMHYYQTAKDVDIGTLVVVTTAHGTYLGKVAKIRKATKEETKKPDFNQDFPYIDRIATFQDQSFEEEAKGREKEISDVTQREADKIKLNMKVMKSYLDINEDKVLITFASEGRVDFRELVRTLNSYFHLKIELRQIGVRDETKILGGIGICGRPLCCHTYLSEFAPVSIKMAKEQNLSLNPTKISGVCGRLMCCLKNEQETYEELNKKMPSRGERVTTPEGMKGEVNSVNVLRQLVKVLVETENEKEIREYHVEELKFKPKKKGKTKNKEHKEAAKKS